MRRTPLQAALAVALAAAMFVPGPAGAAEPPIRVVENGDEGWVINPDPANATAYEFTDEEASIGAGSLKGGPIGSTGAEKFIAALGMDVPVDDLTSISYDFKIGGNGDALDAEQFYLNVYTRLPNSTKYYDCRFDYLPDDGSTTEFTLASFAMDEPADAVRPATCPDTPGEMADGSYVWGIALNIGDTSANDTGLAGFFDNVQIATTSGTTTYDFDVDPETRDDCKNGGWALYGFANQGACVSWVQANPHAGK